MSFTIDHKPDGPWGREFSVRSKKGKMTVRFFWSKNYQCIRDISFHKVDRSERPEFIKALIDHLKTLNVHEVSAWFVKVRSTVRHDEMLTPLGFEFYRDDQYVSALKLNFA
jgi:hypothetical protein